MKIADAFLKLIETETLPHLGSEVRFGIRDSGLLLDDVNRFCQAHSLSNLQSDLARSAAFFWHDDLERSHKISQGVKTKEGSFLHGMMHRREPNASNAKYWFGLVGEHPAFVGLTISVMRLGESEVVKSLLHSGKWDPSLFVDACIRAEKEQYESEIHTLQEIQKLEFEALVSHLFL